MYAHPLGYNTKISVKLFDASAKIHDQRALLIRQECVLRAEMTLGRRVWNLAYCIVEALERHTLRPNSLLLQVRDERIIEPVVDVAPFVADLVVVARDQS